jgi:K+-sensing histidine kinase KdpD
MTAEYIAIGVTILFAIATSAGQFLHRSHAGNGPGPPAPGADGVDCPDVAGHADEHSRGQRGRRNTEAPLKDLEAVPRRQVDYRGVTMEEMDVDAIVRRKPQMCVVDELAHTNVPGSRHAKHYEDVLDILDAGIHVMTAVNIQRLETLNDAAARATGVRVRKTVPDTFLDRAHEVINVDVIVEELRSRLSEGKIYKPATARGRGSNQR